MSLQLTSEQHAALGDLPGVEAVPVFDPRDNRAYFLVSAETYERLRRLVDDAGSGVEPLYALMDEVASREGWDDPAMDAYDRLDPRKLP